MMQKRINYLNEQRQIANEQMEAAKLINDYIGYQQASRAYQSISREEQKWLSDIASLVHPTIADDDWEQMPLGDIAIRLRFASADILTPLDIVHVESLGYQFLYSTRLEFPLPEAIAEQINYAWLTANDSLSSLIRSIPAANQILSYVQGRHMYSIDSESMKWSKAFYYLQNGSNTLMRNQFAEDAYILQIKSMADKDWPVVEQLAIHYLELGQPVIQWEPFE